jgi:uncharacterized repeat protein (TIGR03803 family)
MKLETTNRTWALKIGFISMAAAVSILSACGGSSPDNAGPDNAGTSSSGAGSSNPSPVSVIYTFGQTDQDVVNPQYLIQGSDGTLYGVASAGDPNTSPSGGDGPGNGGIFSVSLQGNENVISSFGSIAGMAPNIDGTLVMGSDGNLYGTTSVGGPGLAGVFYELTPAGAVTVLHAFGSSATDGAHPTGALIQGTDGNFYGITNGGGANDIGSGGDGTVFKIAPDGTETVLYSFGGTTGDGKSPIAGLVQGTDGNFYGVTSAGGSNGYGAVFSVSPAGGEALLYSFVSNYGLSVRAVSSLVQGGTLIQANDGNFYLTTEAGGTSNNGTVFRITPQGSGSVLYSFGSSSTDGVDPGPLLQGSDGNLYGTTIVGGTAGVGTLFELSLSGAETVLYSFGTTNSGLASPTGLLEGMDGHLYGTADSIFMVSAVIPGK